jgi:hypothetical protein
MGKGMYEWERTRDIRAARVAAEVNSLHSLSSQNAYDQH